MSGNPLDFLETALAAALLALVCAAHEKGRAVSGRLSFDYVRRYYGVPAGRGVRVIVDGKPGRITSGNGQYIRVLFDGERRSRICHPTWRVEYLTSARSSGA